jgi:nucleotide-binding universal stress UspA family protein
MAHDPSSFRSILVPLDGSPFAEQAVPLASRIAQRSGSKLRLAFVHKLPAAPVDCAAAKLFTSIEEVTRKAERAYLRGIQAKLREGGIRLSSAVTLTGDPGPALAQYAGEMAIDLVVMATHGRGGIRRAWLGSVADHLIRHLQVPMLLVRPTKGVEPQGWPAAGRILVPLDGSPFAEQALEMGATLARTLDTEVTLLQVVPPVLPLPDPALPGPSAYDEELTELCRAQVQDYLDDVVERLRARGLRATGVAAVGWNTVESILDVARPEQIALVVLATHGRGGLRRLALGSVADQLVRGADVPVLVCRPAVGGSRTKLPSSNEVASGGWLARKGALLRGTLKS